MLENIDYKAATFWYQFAQGLLTLSMFIYVIVTSKQKANASAIELMRKDNAVEKKALKDIIDDETEVLGNRLTKIETKIELMPSHEDMAKLHTRVNETAQAVTGMQGELKQMNNTLYLIHKELLSGGKQ